MVAALARPGFDARSNGVVRFLLLSLALHAAVLFFVRRSDVETSAPPVPPLSVTFSPSRPVLASEPPARTEPAPKSAVAARLPTQSIASPSAPAPTTATISPTPASPTINLDAAIATARAYAHEAQPRTSLDAPKPLLTVETAIARATEPDVIVESRGANGEHVTTSRHFRCVTAIVVPHYMQGMTMPTLCEKR
jgi:hypothetical protein